jgi:hypothetical protein|tara:strand:+ start:1899 stop:2069 length:171 start_codon:yes stop_codon:yes gene_type:complete
VKKYRVRVIETTVYQFEAKTEEEARRMASEDVIWGPYDEGKYDVWIDVEDAEDVTS